MDRRKMYKPTGSGRTASALANRAKKSEQKRALNRRRLVLQTSKKRKFGDVYKNKSQTSRPGITKEDASPMENSSKTYGKRYKPRARLVCDVYKPPVGPRRDPCSEKYAKLNLSVVCNPWVAVDQPKFPDGKAQWSIGRKFRFAEEIRPFDKGNCLIALFPGLNNHAYAVSRMVEDDSANVVLSNHVAETGVAFQTTVEVTNEAQGLYVVTYSPVEKSYESWRPVSVGMRLKSLNTDDEDEGWWEAIRTSRDKVFKEMAVATRVSPASSAANPSKKAFSGNVLASQTTLDEDLNERKSDWMNVPSYCTGKLTHLQFYDFQLNFVREDNEFIPLRAVQAVNPLNTLFREYPAIDKVVDDVHLVTQPPGNVNKSHQVDRIREMVLSDSMDIILVRIHGTKNTKIYMETVSNQEVLVPQEGSYSTYQTPTMAKRDVLAKIIKVRNQSYLLPYQKTRRKL